MYTQAELQDAIDQLHEGKHSIVNCEKLAAIYTVMDHINTYPTTKYSYDSDKTEPTIGYYGDSEFLRAVQGRSEAETWRLIDELMSTLSIVNPRLYDSVMRRL